MRSSTLTLVALLVLAVPVSGQAQVGASASGFVGSYIPIADLVTLTVFPRIGPTAISVSHDPGLMFGGRATLRVARFGIEGEAMYASADLNIFPPEVDNRLPNGASAFLGSLNLMYVVYQAPFDPVSLHVSGGVGYVSHSGDFFDTGDIQLRETSDVAGTIGLGLRFGFTPLIHLRFDIRDYIYSFEPATPNAVLESKLQNDLIGTASIEFAFSPLP